MKISSNLVKDSMDEWLLKTTVALNDINPMVDRIMEDESVEGVVMTNKEGNLLIRSPWASFDEAVIAAKRLPAQTSPYPAAAAAVYTLMGMPILTNINVMGATNYGTAMKKLGSMAQTSVKEIDPFDEVVILRLKTLKYEIMVAHHSEFNIIVLQHSRVTKLKQ